MIANLNITPVQGQEIMLKSIPFNDVHIDDAFWSPRIQINHNTTIPLILTQCLNTGRIDNFKKAAGQMPGEHEGYVFNDSDVYKLIEAMAYDLSINPDKILQQKMDEIISLIAAAQRPDGYLNTYYILNKNNEKPWSDLANMHELYCAGHLFEAAVAHNQTTGETTLLNVAIKFADYIDSVFGPGKRIDVPGHPEIEIGLVKLYEQTNNRKYLKLAEFFLDARGQKDQREKLYGAYTQDHKPVADQRKAVGHAVRAAYLYTAMADVTLKTNKNKYKKALNSLWEDVVSRKLYLTGGIGANSNGESFGKAYELPNKTAYAETCAAIANIMWNQSMLQLNGDAKYADVLELTLYNGFLSGISLKGDKFFYPNPLSFDPRDNFNHGSNTRTTWFNCACCPPNIARLIPSLGKYIYACSDNAIYANLFIGNTANFNLLQTPVELKMESGLPWDGQVKITVTPQQDNKEFNLNLRIPGWAVGKPVPSDLYQYMYKNYPLADVQIKINGQPIQYQTLNGYVQINRYWKNGDTVEMTFPMAVRRVVSPPLEINRGKVALQRGPIVYCFEGADYEGYARNLALDDKVLIGAEYQSGKLGGFVAPTGNIYVKRVIANARAASSTLEEMKAIPYYAWANRETTEMRVWIYRSAVKCERPLTPTISSTSWPAASYYNNDDKNSTINAIQDLLIPDSPTDKSIPRFTFGNHTGTTEWVQYMFDKENKIDRFETYWYRDENQTPGSCQYPYDFRAYYLIDDEWKPMPRTTIQEVDENGYQFIAFDPVTTTGVRLEFDLQPNYSAGILEWIAW